jgi:carboxyl-terminal processing protease
MHTGRWRRRARLAAALLVIAGRVVAAETAVAETAPEWAQVRDETFNMVWTTVNEAYFDPTFGGVDWAAVREKYRTGLPQAADKPALRRLLQAMLNELHRTHFSIQPREMAVFTPAERVRIGTAGVAVAFVEGAVVVQTVKANAAGEHPDLRPGDLILAVDRVELEPLRAYLQEAGIEPTRAGFFLTQMVQSRLRSAVGTALQLRVRDLDGGEHLAKVVIGPHEGDWSEPMGDFPSVPVECTSSPDQDGLVYLRFNVFARQAMKGIRAALNGVPAGGGLVIDLRGNPGGISLMAPGISGWLTDHAFLLATMHLRQGHIGFTVSPQERAFLGPVAILIDSGSASTSEIMASGLQEAGRARIFGETSAGAALPSVFKALPTGDLFQYAIADLQTPHGVLIEGRGVVPDETVRCTRADLLSGRDPVLAAARRWLEAERAKSAAPAQPAKP